MELALWQMLVPRGGHDVEVFLSGPDAVAADHLRTQEADLVKVLQRRFAVGGVTVQLLVHRLLQMDVDAGAVASRQLLDGREEFVGATMHIAGRHRDLHPLVLVVAVFAADLFQNGHDFINRPVARGHEGLVPFRQVGRHSSRKVGFTAARPGNHRVLVDNRGSVGNPHPRGLVRADNLVCDLHTHRAGSPRGRMNRLHRGGAGFDHLDRAVKLVQVGVNSSNADAVQAPHFQRQVGRAHLERSQSNVEVVVDQSRHYDVVAGTDDLGVGVLSAELAVVPDGFYYAVALEHCPVIDHLRRVGARDLADDVLAPYQR